MPNLSEISQWEAGIYKIEEDDVVQGGDDGISNRAAAQLANRTLFLKNQQTAHQEAADPHTQYLRKDQKATEAQAIAGLDNESWMTALRVAQAINALAATIANASETVAGKVELATPAETITGADSTRATHAAGVKAAIDAAVAALLDSSPATLNTLNELAAALGDDPNFATSTAALIALKAPLASPALTGVPTAPTAAPGTSTTQLANTAFIQAALASITSWPGVYQGSDANNLVFPIGTPLMVVDGDYASHPRNSAVSIYLTAGSDYMFTTASGGSMLAGQWRVRGGYSSDVLYERVS